MNYSVTKIKKVIGKFKIETPANLGIDEFVCLRSKMFAFNCANDSRNKLKSVSKSQSKNIKFEEHKKCLDEENFQSECNNYVPGSINHEVHLQEIKKSTISIFDDKRCHINNIESKAWKYYF